MGVAIRSCHRGSGSCSLPAWSLSPCWQRLAPNIQDPIPTRTTPEPASPSSPSSGGLPATIITPSLPSTTHTRAPSSAQDICTTSSILNAWDLHTRTCLTSFDWPGTSCIWAHSVSSYSTCIVPGAAKESHSAPRPCTCWSSFCRYIDIFWNFISLYNTVMKILFIGTTGYILFLMKTDLKAKPSPETESTKALMAIVPSCALLALVLNDHTTECSGHPFDCLVSFLWAFSIYLEAVAIVPQLMLLKRRKIVKNLTGNYIFCLGAYRALYLINWFYRYFVDPISAPEFVIKVCAGLVQTALFFNFFVVYINSKKFGGAISDVILDTENLD